MPIYEFECSKCDDIQEILLGINEKPPKKCECGGKLKKLISLSSFQLKGDGWYSTDYSKNPNPTSMPEPQQMVKMLLSNLSKKKIIRL